MWTGGKAPRKPEFLADEAEEADEVEGGAEEEEENQDEYEEDFIDDRCGDEW
ncbi:hypothetical protein B0H14DRAFT_3463988 [Mycena olivaceomarginata]|nr:hypothetical protein B0H14DRAFT_3463988 [Mycena olivaceomarginata]